jgi:hypothetical protein
VNASAREVEGSLLDRQRLANAVAIDHFIHERLADAEKPRGAVLQKPSSRPKRDDFFLRVHFL